MPAEPEDLRDEYNDFTGTDENWAEWHEIYLESGAIQDDPTSDREMFFEFLNAFYPDVESHNKEYWDDIREAFYELSGITEEDIDWELYREAIGYGRT